MTYLVIDLKKTSISVRSKAVGYWESEENRCRTGYMEDGMGISRERIFPLHRNVGHHLTRSRWLRKKKKEKEKK